MHAHLSSDLTCPALAPPAVLGRSVRDMHGAALRVFQAHAVGVLSIAQAGTRTYSLAADGSLKGWSSATPHEADAEAL
jgi:hypothetical protein